MNFHFGFKCGEYTPAVEARLTQDIIAMYNVRNNINLVCCHVSDEADSVLNSLQVKRVPALTLATLWITYQTSEEAVEVPDYVTTVVERKLFVPQSKLGMCTDPTPKPRAPDASRVMAPRNTIMPPNGTCGYDPGLLLLLYY